MKWIIVLSLMFVMFDAHAEDVGAVIRSQMLDSEIARLTAQRDEKYTALKQCEKTTNGFKIAGLSTLIATGFGVDGNIKLYQKYHNGADSKGASGKKLGLDNRSQEDKNDDSCQTFCDLGMPVDDVPGCSC